MKNYDFDTWIDRRGTGAMKWDWRPQGYGEVVPMSLAEMDFRLPQEVLDDLHKRVDLGIFGYMIMMEEDYRAIEGWMKEMHGQEVLRQWLLPGPGVVPTMRAAQYVLTEPGDQIVVQPPVHTPFFTTASRFDRVEVSVPLKNDGAGFYTMDYAGLETAFAQGAKLMLLCNPQNPMGRVWTREELEKLAQLCIRYDVWLIVDEIHRDLLLPGNKFTPMLDIPGMAQRCIEVFSPSKTFNMGGFHISTAIIPNDDVRKAVSARISDLGLASVRPTMLSIAAQTAVYTKAREWTRELCRYLDGNFDLALDILGDTPLKVRKPEGTYMLWTDCSALGMATDELREFMLSKAHICPELGSVYDSMNYASYKGLQTHMRLTVGMPRKQLEEALISLRNAVNNL